MLTDQALPGPLVQSLYREHHGWLRQWLGRRVGNDDRAADLAHDTFVRLLSARRGSLAGEPRALLRHIAQGLVIDAYRHQAVERAWQASVAGQPAAEAASAESRHLLLDTLGRINMMLEGLPAQTRRTFLMARLDGLTLAEIASRTGLPVITVRRHIRRAQLACQKV